MNSEIDLFPKEKGVSTIRVDLSPTEKGVSMIRVDLFPTEKLVRPLSSISALV